MAFVYGNRLKKSLSDLVTSCGLGYSMRRELKIISEFLDQSVVSVWGIADIVGRHAMDAEFRQAISLGLAYTHPLDPYSETEYDEMLVDMREQLEDVAQELSLILYQFGIKHYIVPSIAADETTLKSIFSHKLAATCAGIGWIGKCSLLVTEQYGPRISLATVLTQTRFPVNKPCFESKCFDCRSCVDACPYRYMTNIDWKVGMDRERLIDAFGCRLTRLQQGESLGRLSSCGLCLLACPRGKSYLEGGVFEKTETEEFSH
jgi:epoxyqueuosine reductase